MAGQEGSESGWRSKKFVAEGGRAFSVTRDTVELHFLEGRRGFISLSAEASLWRAIRCKLRCLPVLASARRITRKMVLWRIHGQDPREIPSVSMLAPDLS